MEAYVTPVLQVWACGQLERKADVPPPVQGTHGKAVLAWVPSEHVTFCCWALA